jgi:hypothetical protein
MQMQTQAIVWGVLISLLIASAAFGAVAGERAKSEWVWFGDDGKLQYKEDERGNRVPDFSNCGYMGGGVRIPMAPVRAVVEPGEGDDGERIQAAIDQVAQMPQDNRGLRGAVLLRPGTYEIEGALRIRDSGVVLRGSGRGEDGTILIATGTEQRSLIQVGGEGSYREVPGTRRRITDEYVPVGARSFTVQDTSPFSVGDQVIVLRPTTAEWVSEIGMDWIPERPDGGRIVQWAPGSRNLHFDRIITAIDGDRITIDAPLVNALDQQFGGGEIYRYEFPGRISQVGVENLRGVADYKGERDENREDHSWTLIQFDQVQNGWIRQITSYHFAFGLARTARTTKWVTVEDCATMQPVSEVRGGRRYPYYLMGQMILFQQLYSEESRHDVATGSNVAGPGVFLDCFARDAVADSGPHHRWATGTLYDNVHVPGHSIRVQNRLRLGSGHGWAGANMVLWNCAADHYMIQNPPTAQNWIIGSIGEIREPSFGYEHGEIGIVDSHGQHVEPRSLYLAQLEDRLGPEAIQNIQETTEFDLGE